MEKRHTSRKCKIRLGKFKLNYFFESNKSLPLDITEGLNVTFLPP